MTVVPLVPVLPKMLDLPPSRRRFLAVPSVLLC